MKLQNSQQENPQYVKNLLVGRSQLRDKGEIHFLSSAFVTFLSKKGIEGGSHYLEALYNIKH